MLRMGVVRIGVLLMTMISIRFQCVRFNVSSNFIWNNQVFGYWKSIMEILLCTLVLSSKRGGGSICIMPDCHLRCLSSNPARGKLLRTNFTVHSMYCMISNHVSQNLPVEVQRSSMTSILTWPNIQKYPKPSFQNCMTTMWCQVVLIFLVFRWN